MIILKFNGGLIFFGVGVLKLVVGFYIVFSYVMVINLDVVGEVIRVFIGIFDGCN